MQLEKIISKLKVRLATLENAAYSDECNGKIYELKRTLLLLEEEALILSRYPNTKN